MAATIYLHIGANKTGTSAIQYYFNKYRNFLSNHGILYPLSGISGDAHYCLSSQLGFVQGKSQHINLMSKPLLELLKSIRKEIEESGASDVVVSSEYFVLPKAVEPVRSFFKEFDVKIVVYLRRHDKWWPSSYNQAVRTVVQPPWGRGFRSYYNYYKSLNPCPSRGAYRLLIERWKDVFGKENIIVRPFEMQQNQPGVIADFLRAIGRGDVSEMMPVMNERLNDSVDLNTLALVEAFQRANIDSDIRAKLVRYTLENRRGSSVGVSIEPQLLLDIVNQYRDDYEYIAREYLGRDDGRLFYDPLPDVSVPWHKVKQPKPEELVEMVLGVIAGQSTGTGADITLV